MEELVSILYDMYIMPYIEDDEYLGNASELYQDLTPRQKDLCVRVEKLSSSKAFLLGVRTGAALERFLSQDAPDPGGLI